jgi:hypothetical protein
VKKLNLLVLPMLLAIISCQKQPDFKTSSLGSRNALSDSNVFTKQEVTVFTFEDVDGSPLADAEVLVGTSISDPFKNNFLKTDANGQIEVNESFSNTPVTISAPNHLRTTYFGVNPGSQKFQIRKSMTKAMIPLRGNTTGYGNLKRDNLADFSVVIQGISREDFLAFDLNMLISPEKDIISIEDQKVAIPSNIAFPRQTENYVIPITFEKPSYRLFMPSMGPKKIYALHGQLPFKETINELRHHAPFTSLINYFKFISASLTDINVDGTTQQDLSVNSISFTNKVSLNTIAVPADKTMVLISAAEIEDRLYPADLKKIEGNAVTATLNSMPIGSQFLVAALKRSEDFYTNSPKEFGLSAMLIHASETEVANQTPFIDLIEAPAVDLDAWKVKNAPKTQSAINELATYAMLSHFNKSTRQKDLVWEAYAPGWVDQMNLPLWPDHFSSPLTSQGDTTNTWEVSYLGTTETINNKSANLGPSIIAASTHVSYNKKEFQ